MNTDLELKLARLQRRQSALWVAVVVPWIVLAALGAQWARGGLVLPFEVRARGFAVEREGHGTLARLGAGRLDDGGLLVLHNDRGGTLIRLGNHAGQGGAVDVHSSSGKRTGRFGMADDGTPVVSLGNEEGHEIAVLATTPDGGGALALRTSSGGALFKVANTDIQEPRLELYSAAGTESAFLESSELGGVLRLYAPGGSELVYAGASSHGAGFVGTYAASGSITAAMGQTTSGLGGFVKSFGGEGVPLFFGGANDEGDGQITVFSRTGQQIFAAGPDGRNQGGVINVHDMTGKMVLRAPDWP